MNNKQIIKLLVMDVDGTLTDGKIYMGPNGEVFKAFNIKDGYGINEILPEIGVTPVIITGRESKIVQNRAEELHIDEVYQGKHDKTASLFDAIKRHQCSLSNVAYIGDDVLDLTCMNPIAGAGGIVGCPADAVKEVIEVANYVCTKPGGSGAVREFIEYLKELQA